MDSTPLLKHISPFLQWAKDWATWEVIGAAGAFFGLTKKKTTAVDDEKATKDGNMALTPDGWENQQRRFEDSDPIRPK